MDLISRLPDPILYKIFSLLPDDRSLPMAILSKRFQRASRSSPNIIVDGPKLLFLNTHEKRRAFLNGVQELIRTRVQIVDLQKFRLRIFFDNGLKKDPPEWIKELQKMINGEDHMEEDHNEYGDIVELIAYVLDKCVGVVDISLYGNWFCPCPLLQVSAVTTLKLDGFRPDVEKLLQGCPKLEELSLYRCEFPAAQVTFSSTKLERLVLNRIRCITKTNGKTRIKIEAPNLKTLALWGFDGCLKPAHEVIDIDPCLELKDLQLGNMVVTDDWLQKQISNHLKLKDLSLHHCKCVPGSNSIDAISFGDHGLRSLHLWFTKIDDGWLEMCLRMFFSLTELRLSSCSGLQRPKISHEKLEILSLVNCGCEAEIDTPRLHDIYLENLLQFDHLIAPTSLRAFFLVDDESIRHKSKASCVELLRYCKELTICFRSNETLVLMRNYIRGQKQHDNNLKVEEVPVLSQFSIASNYQHSWFTTMYTDCLKIQKL